MVQYLNPSPSAPLNSPLAPTPRVTHPTRNATPQVSKDWRDDKDALDKYGYFNPMMI